MTIQLHRLEGFYWVAIYEGYAEAARNFPHPLTQPAVHQQVKKLELELGCKLFERVAKDRVRLTVAGRRLFDFCAPFFEELPAVERALRTQDFEGELRIEAVDLAIRSLLPPWIRRLQRAHPKIRVAMREVPRPELDRLRTGEADLVVDIVDELPRGFGRTEVATWYAFLLTPPDHPAGRHKRPRLEALSGTPLVAYAPDTRQHQLQLSTLERLGVSPRAILSAPSAESILSFVAAGLGFSLLPWPDKDGPEGDWAAHRLKGAGTQFPVHAVYREGPGAQPLVDAALALRLAAKDR